MTKEATSLSRHERVAAIVEQALWQVTGLWLNRSRPATVSNPVQQISDGTPVGTAMKLYRQPWPLPSQELLHSAENIQLHSLDIDLDAVDGISASVDDRPQPV